MVLGCRSLELGEVRAGDKNLRVGCIRMAFKVWVRSRREGRWRGEKEPESSGPFCCTAAHTEEEEAATATESSQ